MFGQPQSTTASTTGTSNLFGTTAPSGGFSFGGASAAGAAPSGGFSFGQSTATPKPGGFSFGTTPAQPQQQQQQQQQQQPQTQAPPSFSFATSAAASKPAGGFSFGATPATTQSAAPGLTLGGATGGFKFGDAAKSQTATAPSAGGFAFSTPSGSTTATTAPASSAGFSLSQPTLSNPTGAPAAALASSATSVSTGGGFSLGGTTGGFKLGGVAPTATTGGTASTAAVVQPTQPATSLSTAGGLGGGLGGGMKLGGFSLPTSTTQTTSAPSGLSLGLSTTSAPGGLSLGTATTSAPSLGGGLKLGTLGATPASSSVATSSTAGLGLGLMGAKPTTTAAQGAGLGANVVAATATMSYRELEECINKWTVELEEQEKIFLNQAAQVNAWDRMLVNNGEKITSLHTDLETVKTDQQRLEHELDYIVAQQRELEDILVPLEEACKSQEGSLYRQHTDVERERTYQMSENIDSQLKRMVQDLKEIIDHMNTSSTSSDQADPIGQVAKILNAHMNSLQWIDQNTGLLQRKVDEVTRQYEIVRRDQERNVHLAFE